MTAEPHEKPLINIMNADGSEITFLTDRRRNPVWSARGDRILLIAEKT